MSVVDGEGVDRGLGVGDGDDRLPVPVLFGVGVGEGLVPSCPTGSTEPTLEFIESPIAVVMSVMISSSPAKLARE